MRKYILPYLLILLLALSGLGHTITTEVPPETGTTYISGVPHPATTDPTLPPSDYMTIHGTKFYWDGSSHNGLTPSKLVAQKNWANESAMATALGAPMESASALSSALGSIGTTHCTLHVPRGTYTISADTTIPANVELRPERGAIFIIAPSKSLAINGGLEAGRYQVFSCASTGKVTGLKEVDVKWFGAAGDGAADDTLPIQKAIDSVCPVVGAGYAGIVNFPNGLYRTTRVIDATNNRVAGTISRDGLTLKGKGMYNTRLLGETGSGKAIIETTGSQWLTLEDIFLGSGSANKSTVGIFQGLGTVLPQTQNQKFKRVYVNMHDDATTNGGAGTIGIWNFGAEENTYDTCYVYANLPAFFTGYNPSPNLHYNYTNSYQKSAASHSLGITSFIGETFLVTIGRRGPCIVLEDVNSFHGNNVYLANLGTGGMNNKAIAVYGSANGVELSGTIESHATALYIRGTLQQAKCRFTFGPITATTTHRIELDRGASQGIIIASNINLMDTVSPARPLFQATPIAANEIISCYIQNSVFKVNADKAFLNIPANTLYNPRTGNVRIEGLRDLDKPYSYEVGVRSQKIHIPKTIVLQAAGPAVTSAEVARIILPTPLGTGDASSMTVKMEGMLSINNSGTNSRSTKFVSMIAAIALLNDGKVTTTADVLHKGIQANVHAAGNSITDIALTATPSGTAYVQLILMATTEGVNAESVTFIGDAEMYWDGGEARAPLLKLP
jgi:hypothetical protein